MATELHATSGNAWRPPVHWCCDSPKERLQVPVRMLATPKHLKAQAVGLQPCPAGHSLRSRSGLVTVRNPETPNACAKTRLRSCLLARGPGSAGNHTSMFARKRCVLGQTAFSVGRTYPSNEPMTVLLYVGLDARAIGQYMFGVNGVGLHYICFASKPLSSAASLSFWSAARKTRPCGASSHHSNAAAN